jgi:3-oxoacyl-[acyl-carrier protein] reductase
MLLENKNAVIYGAGGSIGGAVAKGYQERGREPSMTGQAVHAGIPWLPR